MLLSSFQNLITVIKKRPTKEEIENSDWTSCCKGPVLKNELKDTNLYISNCDRFEEVTKKLSILEKDDWPIKHAISPLIPMIVILIRYFNLYKIKIYEN